LNAFPRDFDAVGWTTGRTSASKKPVPAVPVILKGFLSEEMEKEAAISCPNSTEK